MTDIFTPNLVMFSTAMGFSTVSSFYDMKTGEIPDKFSIGLVIVALALRAIFSFTSGDINYLIDGFIVGAIFFSFGAVLFYTGGWGGGDAKLVAGIGAALGGAIGPTIIDSSFLMFPVFFGFFVSMAIVAIPYSLGYALVLSFKAPNVFSLVKKRVIESWELLIVAIVASIIMINTLKPWNTMLYITALLPPVFYILIIFTRSVEEVAMQRKVPVSKLKEGDLVAENIIINGKKVASKRDMDGLTKEAIKKIKNTKNGPKIVKIKWGIKFAPAFPLALIVCPFWASIMRVLL